MRRYFPGEDVLGHSVRLPRLTSQPPYLLSPAGSDGWLQVIGVAADALNDGLSKPILPAIYLPYSMNMFMGTQILVRTQGEPLAMLHNIRQQVAAVNPDQQVFSRVNDLQTWITREPEWARSRLVSILFAGFSALALVLAAVGLYSVVSYSVVQRTGEFGIRMALGAQRFDVLRIVLLSAGTSVGLGLVSGNSSQPRAKPDPHSLGGECHPQSVDCDRCLVAGRFCGCSFMFGAGEAGLGRGSDGSAAL